MSQFSRHLRSGIVAVLASFLVFATACGNVNDPINVTSEGPGATTPPGDLDAFVGMLRNVKRDFKPFGSLDEVVVSTDAVIVGRLISAVPGRQIFGNADVIDEPPAVETIAITVQLESQIAGTTDVSSRTFIVEVPISPADGADEVARQLPTGHRALFAANDYTTPSEPTVAIPTEPGTIYLRPHAQGFVIEGDNGELVSATDNWRNGTLPPQITTFDQLVEALNVAPR